MGIYATKFREDNASALPSNKHPSKADWITSHAVATKLAIVEVERLWTRFEQLGCNDDGELTDEIFQRNSSVMEDIFSRNILTVLRSDDGTIKFLTFLNCMQWAESASQEQKISAVFQLLNNGKPLHHDIVMRIIARMYPDDSKSEHTRLTDILMDQLCGNSQGEVSEAQFVHRVKALPPEVTARLFGFLIIPHEINEEAHRTFTSLSKITGAQTTANSVIPEEPEPDASHQIPSDQILRKIAEKIHTRDWHILANRLGFTAADITELERINDQSSEEQVLGMLKEWKRKEGSMAYAGTLEKQLQECNMNDAAILLYP